MQPIKQTRIGLIGYGAIGGTVARAISAGKCGDRCKLVSVLARNERKVPDGVKLFTSGDSPQAFEQFMASDWDLCIEAAGQQTVRNYGVSILSSGRDLLVTSIGALTDDKLYNNLLFVSRVNGTNLHLCSGSMPGLDWMQAASFAAEDDPLIHSCTVTQLKPPQSWKGTPAEDKFDLMNLKEYTVLYEGFAREAATLFPKNSNVACALALATVGLDNCRVILATDPSNPKGGSTINYSNKKVGDIKIEVNALMSPENPKTSAVVPLSVVKAIRNLTSNVAHGI